MSSQLQPRKIEIREANQALILEAAERIFGYSAEEAIGKGLHETIVPEKYREEHLKGFDKFKDSGKGAFIGKTFETSARKKDGTVFPIDISITAVKLKDQWCAIGIIRDITERLRSEELLRINYKMASLGRLTAGVFHEIFNPVNIISSHIQLLLTHSFFRHIQLIHIKNLERVVNIFQSFHRLQVQK